MFSTSHFAHQGITPPLAKRVPHVTAYHGLAKEDPYFWLRERSNPEVLAHLAAENAYTKEVMADTKPLQAKLYQEMRSRLREEDMSVPTRDGDYFYYTRTEQGKQYSIHCRRRGTMEAAEEIVLDENTLAEGNTYFHLGIFETSPNHEVLAYATDTNGSEEYTLYFVRVATGEQVRAPLSQVSDFEWADNERFMLTTMDATRRAHQLYLGALTRELTLVYEEPDELFYLDLAKSKDDKYIFPSRASKDTAEVWLIPAAAPETPMRSVYGMRPKMQYLVDTREDVLYVIAYGETPHGRLLMLPVGRLDTQQWQEILPESNIILEDMECFQDYILLMERARGVQQLSIFDPISCTRTPIAFEEPLRALVEYANYEYASPTFRVVYSSFVTPTEVREYDAKTSSYRVLKQQYAGSQYDPTAYTQERIFATASDGTKIPISLVCRRDLFRKDGSNPMFLYGYGAYGIIYDPQFSGAGLSLLDRGFVFAIAHIRGGGEFGRAWYEGGKLAAKQTTFTDFVACMEHVIAERYTSPAKLTIGGRSAGGLLMGAVTTMRPDLIRAAIVGVPFVDVMNTMMDPSLTSTTLEYEEWGNPNILEELFK